MRKSCEQVRIKTGMKNKKGFEFSFGWLFAIIIGAVIIFLAIFATSRLINTEKVVADTEAGKQLGIILTPLEATISEGRVSRINLQKETRVYNDCDITGNFGKQGLSVSTKSNVGEEWDEPGVKNMFYNKYVFSSQIVQGKSLEVFSKTIKMPFRIASLIFLWSDQEEYCFINSPSDVENEIESLETKNINLTSSISSCAEESIKVCFDSNLPKCDITVSSSEKSVKNNLLGSKVYYDNSFDNSLLYGAILSDPRVYECQLKRLMKRSTELSRIYLNKANVLNSRGCRFETLFGYMESYADQTSEIKSSTEILEIVQTAQLIEGENDNLICKLY